MEEEEVTYSTVVRKSTAPPPKAHAESKEDRTVYADVKCKETPSAAKNAKDDESSSNPWLLCLGFIVFLLVGSIIAIIILVLQINDQKVNLSDLAAEIQQLELEKRNLENKTEDLSWALGVILSFETFPVGEYCTDGECRPCRNNWMLFREKCYLIDQSPPRYKTWEESRQACLDKTTDLLIIDDLQEQEFLSNNIPYYLDKYHGYWFGLEKRDETWMWIDGRNDTHMFWIEGGLGDSGPCAMMIPKKNATVNWDPADCKMENRFICEGKALFRSNETLLSSSLGLD